jgi:hypothetical protein
MWNWDLIKFTVICVCHKGVDCVERHLVVSRHRPWKIIPCVKGKLQPGKDSHNKGNDIYTNGLKQQLCSKCKYAVLVFRRVRKITKSDY